MVEVRSIKFDLRRVVKAQIETRIWRIRLDATITQSLLPITVSSIELTSVLEFYAEDQRVLFDLVGKDVEVFCAGFEDK